MGRGERVGDRPGGGVTPRDPEFGLLTPETLSLFTDRYELAMMQGYYEAGHDPRATFDLFFRSLPADRGYVVAAGLEQVVHYLEHLTFGDEALDYLADLGFSAAFRSSLAEFESLVLNQVGYQSLVATKAARMRDVVDREGDGQSLVDFGSRRAHGTDAGLKAAQAAYVGGFTGTSNVAAGAAFDLPVVGTMAHSWVQSFLSERAAFEAFVDVYGDSSVLLVDTYDTVAGAETAMAVAADRGVDLAGVRLDSGDLVALSRRVAEVVGDTPIVVSSGVDEYEIAAFLAAGGVAAGFGPGTALTTSADAPSLDVVYKLVAVERDGEVQPSMKLSTGKTTYPCPKSVRRVERDGRFHRDVIGRRDETGPGEELLVDVFEAGSRVYSLPDLGEVRDRRRDQVASLPSGVRALRDPVTYPVRVSDGLAETTERLRADLRGTDA
ncbi:MAG: nicotinate phosphoribosyltransferase [Halorientalis sp.]